ncbi:MAG: cyclopropane fatty-acyl-phospholipid synthase-like methyltransferase [Polaribacter sp.]|jgi:cyclopropane fatty-acyl-phospholipid synthase-like methyltransferase
MTEAQFKEGVAYSEDNFQNDNAPHLHIDKKLIKERFDLTGKRILDFGCGMGGMSVWYATNWDCSVYGLDIDKHHVTIANHLKEKHKVDNVTFEKRNILNDKLKPEERFDYIFLNDVAEHIAYPILEEIFQVLEAGLAEGGKIFVTYPPWKSPYASHVTHAVNIPWCQYLPNGYLMNLIEKNNMQIVGEEESDLVEAYKGLNHLTHKKLTSTIKKKTNLKPVFRKSHCILNKLPGLGNSNINFFPFDFLVTKEFLLLEKGK